MRKVCGLFAVGLFILSSLCIAFGLILNDFSSSPLYKLATIYIIVSLPGSIIASVSKRSDMTWLSSIGMVFLVVFLILFMLYNLFNIQNLLMVQLLATLLGLILMTSYIALLCHIQNNNIAVSLCKAVSVILILLFGIIIIWNFWAIKETSLIMNLSVPTKFLTIVLLLSLGLGILSFMLSVTFYEGERVESDVVRFGNVSSSPQIIGVGATNNMVNNQVNNPYLNAARINVQPNFTNPNQLNNNDLLTNVPINNVNNYSTINQTNNLNEIPVMSTKPFENNQVNNPYQQRPTAVPDINLPSNNNVTGSNIVNIPLDFINPNVVSQNPVNNNSNNVPPVVNIPNNNPNNNR